MRRFESYLPNQFNGDQLEQVKEKTVEKVDLRADVRPQVKKKTATAPMLAGAALLGLAGILTFLNPPAPKLSEAYVDYTEDDWLHALAQQIVLGDGAEDLTDEFALWAKDHPEYQELAAYVVDNPSIMEPDIYIEHSYAQPGVIPYDITYTVIKSDDARTPEDQVKYFKEGWLNVVGIPDEAPHEEFKARVRKGLAYFIMSWLHEPRISAAYNVGRCLDLLGLTNEALPFYVMHIQKTGSPFALIQMLDVLDSTFMGYKQSVLNFMDLISGNPYSRVEPASTSPDLKELLDDIGVNSDLQKIGASLHGLIVPLMQPQAVAKAIIALNPGDNDLAQFNSATDGSGDVKNGLRSNEAYQKGYVAWEKYKKTSSPIAFWEAVLQLCDSYAWYPRTTTLYSLSKCAAEMGEFEHALALLNAYETLTNDPRVENDKKKLQALLNANKYLEEIVNLFQTNIGQHYVGSPNSSEREVHNTVGNSPPDTIFLDTDFFFGEH